MSDQEFAPTSIAIVGMSGRFPGASNIDEFWRNLRDGVESVQFFSDEEVLASGVSRALLNDPNYVKARAIFEGAELFDASFFGYNPREAAIMDPQQRLFLECSYEALEHAGYNSAAYAGLIGVFGGVSMNTYLLANLYPNRDLIGLVGDLQSMIGNDKDYLATRVSYKLDLKGPGMTVQTACSTSLVAVSLACQSLLQYQCDMALAGGSSIGVPQRAGYIFQEGSLGSPDGHCRAFDASGHGPVGGDGVGVVVLKRLEDALQDGDTIHAVIIGFALNNDGLHKAGYTAPSIEGQAQAIAAAQAMAEVDPATISYIEAHGTATPLGDPIEIAALTQAFRARTDKTGYCAIGSVKTNIGHLNAAAGVAGLIKTTLALKHKRIPPSLHYRQPNPAIDFANSPFFVNARLMPWVARGGPRRAGVSSFGIGGTNAHVIVEEAPAVELSGPARPWQLLLLSAHTPSALEAATDNLAAYLEQDAHLADVAYTLQVGRRSFGHRRALLCQDREDARRALADRDRGRLLSGLAADGERPVAFLFPGAGAQHVAMAADLYQHEPIFRREIDRCVELVRPQIGLDLRQVLYPAAEQVAEATRQLRQTGIALPTLFIVEYALAQLWMSWGIRPAGMIGHSMGEYVAATLAGVFSLEDALRLVVLRGRLMQQIEPGAMLSVAAEPDTITSLMGPDLSLAAINGPALCVVSGTIAALQAFEQRCSERDLQVRQLHIDVAAHSSLIEPILPAFTSFVQTLRLHPPQLPYISNVTGTLATAADATDPHYWARHLRQTVRFADGLHTLRNAAGGSSDLVLLEVGPGRTLTTLARAQVPAEQIVLASMRHPTDQQPDDALLLATLGQLWLAGAAVDWAGFSRHEQRHRLPLPTYPFERQRYWVDPPAPSAPSERRIELLHIPSGTPAVQPVVSEQSAFHPRPYLPNEYVAPRNERERLIAEVWQNLLGIAPIGVEDNFFALGGHSLLAAQVITRVSEACRVELALRTLFEQPTIAGLAEHAALAVADAMPAVAPAIPSIPSIPRDGALPLSFAQQRLWFIDQLAQGISAYTIPAAVQLRGRLDSVALERALAEVVRRHETLRTTFALVAGQPVQIVAPAEASSGSVARLQLHDLRALPAAEREAEAQRLATEEAQRPFDLSAGPLLRVALLRLADEQHMLMLALHHIIADGWSIGLLLRELTALYAAFAQGAPAAQPSPLPDLTVQYADFAAWQRHWLAAEHQGAAESMFDEQLRYWQRQLAGAPTLQLPTDRPRPPVSSFRGTNQTFTLPLALADQLRALSQQEGCTLFMTLLAAFQTLLSRYSAQDDIVVSTAVANRRRPELEDLIGCFINILVLRADLTDQPHFRALLARVREVCLQAYAHQDLPFELLVERLHPERDLSYNPLAQVMFIVQNTPLELRDLPDLRVEPVTLFERAAAQFDLTMHIWEQPDGLRGIVEYNTDLFDQATIMRLIGHWETLLQAIVADPDQRTSALPLLSPAERQQLAAWNATAIDQEPAVGLHELVAAQAQRTPDAVALICEGQTLSYAELNRRANQLARYLQACGVRREARVGVGLERSLDLVVALLAALKAGAAYVPLDPGYPPARLQFLVTDAAPAVVLTTRPLVAALGFAEDGDGPPLVCLDEVAATLAAQPAHNLELATDPDQLAYLIYTSGSTGQPKGALNTHGGIVNRLRWMQAMYGLTSADRVLQKTPFSFDVSVWEFFWPLITGAQLVIARPGGHQDPAYLVDLIRQQQITTLHFVPSLLQVFLQEPDVSRCTSLRRVICSGEALPFELQQRFFDRLDAELHNLYGPTEAAVDVTAWACVRDSADPVVPIGWPIANTQTHILDPQLRPVPVGVAGELYLGGVQLARGYWQRPALTAERFLPDPFSQAGGARLYRTGDRARYRPDGAIEYLGRLDEQVKLRGFRIEPGEIAAALRAHAAVAEAAVVMREDGPGGQQLVAYIVEEQQPADQPANQANEHEPAGATDQRSAISDQRRALRTFLAQRLPEYMIPAVFVTLPALPLSPNGKLDRTALPAPVPEDAAGEPPLAEPHTPIQALLAAIWADVLGRERVDLHDNFFDLGGHSLLATQVVARVRAALNTSLPLRDLFEARTVAGMAERIAATRAHWTLPSLRPVARDGALPLSFAQQRLWFLQQLQPGSPFYNIPIAVQLSGQLDRAALEHSLGDVLRRHETLRTTFVELADVPRQVVAPPSAITVSLPLIDLRAQPAADRERAARQIVGDEARRPFDLAHGPLLRAALIQLDEQEHVLALTLHHIIADGWSLGLLIRELAALYEAHRSGTPAALPPLAVQYADYAVWQQQCLAQTDSGALFEAQRTYWARQLADLTPLQLPVDRPRPASQTFNGALHRFTLPPSLAAGLARLSRQESCTLFMTLLAAFQALLQRTSGQQDIVIGTPVAGRTQPETEPLIGCFINTLVLRTDFSDAPTFRQLLARVRETALQAYDHQELPFELLVEMLQPARDLSRHPLVQVLFALQNAALSARDISGLSLRPLELSSATARLDLSLSMTDTADGLVGVLEYNTDLFDAATVARLAGHLQTLLEGAVADPDRRIAELPLLVEAERRQLLIEWNATSEPAIATHCIHSLFEAQAARTPDAIAALFARVGRPAEALTYAELNRRANQLAHYLQAQGVGPETRVGLLVDRSLDLLVGLLGILKAGGAYVPLDPAYPVQRLQFMIDDAQVAVLLTQQSLVEGRTAVETPIVRLDADWTTIATCSAANLPGDGPGAPRPEHLCYVIYTSGSTGRPKGVLLSHASLSNQILGAAELMQLGVGSRVLQFASFSFDASLWEIFIALVSGAAVCLASRDDLLPGPNLLALLREQQITLAHLSPSVLMSLPATELPQLDTIVAGTEHCSAEVVARWAPGRRFFNAYGPTETTIYATIQPCDEPQPQGPPIGRPVANIRTYILNERLEPVPIGVVGELYIGGVGVARGYLDRPALTAERFLPDPFSGRPLGTPGARLYRTGDLARYRPDGAIVYLGRRDQQVKLRGFRIELGEIEAALLQHPAVRECLVQPIEVGPGETRLVAYVVGAERVPSGQTKNLEPGRGTDSAQVLVLGSHDLRNFLAERLPDYMLPSMFVPIAALPLSPNGKVDRAALLVPDDARAQLVDAFVAPRTPVEQDLAAIWAEVLHVERVGVNDNFFELGGHSLLAAQIISRVRGAFGAPITLRALFETPTIAGLAAAIEDARDAPHELEDIPLIARGRQSLDQLLDELAELPDETIASILTGELDGSEPDQPQQTS